jgi:hypothetical protein
MNKRTVVIGKKGGVKNRVLRRLFGYMGEELSRNWRMWNVLNIWVAC